MQSLIRLFLGCSLICWGSSLCADPPVDYARDIKPILTARCYACHGALKQEASLRLDTGTFALQGGDSGPAVMAKNPDESPLIERISEEDADLRMPPEGKPLTAEQIAMLTAWVAAGAPVPPDEQPQADPRQHWSFQTPVRPNVPQVKNTAWIRNPIDAFIAAQHEQHRLTPQAPATKEALLRRVYIDLIGLPPTRKERQAFLADPSQDAYEKVVDDLLARPQYGERWGRHWMDVWRYSDWYGRRGVNDVRNSYAQIWRWRDWIVNSLNSDKGYDRMVMEMLAADEIVPEDDEAIVATGYIVRNWYSLNYNTWMKDLVEHTGKAFLAMRLNCAHCHDHKYDPVSQEEYFRFRAFFEPLEIRRDRVQGEPDPGPFKPYVYASSTAPITSGLVRVIDKTLDAKTFMYHMGDSRNLMKDVPPTPPAAPAILGGAELPIKPVSLPPVAHYPGLKPFIQQDALQQSTTALQAAEAGLATAQATKDPQQIQIAELTLAHARAQQLSLQARLAADQIQHQGADGNVEQITATAASAERFAAILAAQLQKANAESALATAKDAAAREKATEQRAAAEKTLAEALKAAAEKQDSQYTPLSPTYPKTSTGRRKALAEWIADKKNPRTARVAVNHIWMRHFGAPLVPSVTDFGLSGEKPTHPQLLDWLAVELMQEDWRMKPLHRLIVTSNAYCMQAGADASSQHNRKIDPDNVYLWRYNPRRMETEVIRDSILYLAGELDLTMGGKEIESKDAEKSKRRSLYFSRHPEAGGTTVFMSQFDAPDPCDCYRRSDSIVPQQALALTNSDLLLEQSKLLFSKLSGESSLESEDAFVIAAYEQILSRAPSAEEQKLCRQFLDRQRTLYQETGTQETAQTNHDAQRARESLIRVLFNHNDFVMIP